MRAVVYRCDRPGCTVEADATPTRAGFDGLDFTVPRRPAGWVVTALADMTGERREYELCSARCLDLLLDALCRIVEGES